MDLLTYPKRALLLCAAAIAVSACVPDVDSDESTVIAPRVLAIEAEPAEAAPNATVRYRALVVDGSGVRSDLPLSWFHCLAQKPLAELGPIDRDCLYAERARLAPLGAGQAIEATLPADACALFGPNPPLPMADKPPGRPVDADESGGYKLPVIAGLGTQTGSQAVLYEQRISCGLAGVSPDLSFDYAQRYHANQNPRVAALRVVRASGASELVSDLPVQVAVAERIELEVAWPDCPLSDSCGDGVCGADEGRMSCAQDCEPLRGCAGAERYVVYDREKSQLVVRREALRVAWYATAGSFDEERTGVEADVPTQRSSNVWQAPSSPATATIWVVLRDSRGGVGSAQLTLQAR
jgi:hypothetical protein